MQSKLGKRTDLKQCCTDRRDAQMRCDATRIPQLTTATTHIYPKTSPRSGRERRRGGGGERRSRRSAANIPFQESFETKTKMTKFWAASNRSAAQKKKHKKWREKEREREHVLLKSAEKRNRQERWREGRGKRSRQWSARGEWTLRQVVAGCVGMKVMQRNTHKHRETHTHTDRHRHTLMVSAALAFVVVGSARETS